MAIKRSDIAKQLVPGLNKIFGLEYNDVLNEHKMLFEVEKSMRNFEEELKQTGFGLAYTKPEGTAVKYDDAQEFYTSRYIHETIAIGYIITEEAVEDNLYDSVAKMRTKALGRAMANTKEIKAANVFNNGFNAAFAGGDGVPLFSASHPDVVGGVHSNTVAVDLSETALENAAIAFGSFKDDRGILIAVTGKSLHIPQALQFTAFKILKSDLSTTPMTNVAGTENVSNKNDINALRSGGYFSGGVHINHRFTDTDAWFIKTDVPNGTKMFNRIGIQMGTEGDFDTGNFKYKARERYSFGWSEWRSWYGSSGA